MTGTITLTSDIVNKRIGVQLGAWVTPANGSLVVKRVHPDTTEWTVRGSGPGGTIATSGGAAFSWDYEAPFNVPVTYYAFDGTTKVTSSPVTLAVPYALLRGPGLPANDVQLRVLGKPQMLMARPMAKMQPLGRETAIVWSDTRKAPQFSVQVRTKTLAEFTALENTLKGSATCLLYLPRSIKPWQYVAIGDATPLPETDYVPPVGAPADHIGNWYTWTLPCTVQAQPTGGIFGDPTASYQVIRDTYATYQDLKNAKATYVLVLRGL